MSQVHPPVSPVFRRLWRAVGIVVATGVALVIAEGAVRLIRKDAFPFLNIFVADAEFGVRLQPDACARTRTRAGRVTSACTNANGFRGAPWNEASESHIVVVGDSQVFGYAVDDAQTFPAQLQAKLHEDTSVVNLGVPTWGPIEYVAAAKRFAEHRKISHLVVVINAANDFFEANVDNTRRMTARDGFAKRVHNATTPSVAQRNDRAAPATWLDRSQLLFLVRSVVARSKPASPAPRAQAATLLLRDHQRLQSHAQRRGQASVVQRSLENAAAFCDAHGCKLAVVALPIDVQVDATAWSKYGRPQARRAPNMLSTLALLDGVVAAANAVGAVGIGMHASLSALAPGTAYLADDDHLSPAGHAVVADAIATALALPLRKDTK